MRVVLDTNVLISAVLYGGRLQFILDLLERGVITPCFSRATWGELGRVFDYPQFVQLFAKHELAPEAVLARLEMQSVFVEDTASPIPIPNDRTDEAVLACALAAPAKVLVTGDQHLLALDSLAPIPIIKPSAFKKWLKV